MFQAVNSNYYILAKGAYSQRGVKVHFVKAPGLGNFIAGVNYYHLDYTNQEIDRGVVVLHLEQHGQHDAEFCPI